MLKIRILPFIFAGLCLCTSCTEKIDHRGRHPLVEVKGHFLYQEDLRMVLPANIASEDSLSFAENYIQSWVEDVLLYEKAEHNIPNSATIERLVDNYRRSLIISTYQQELIAQDLSEEIPEEEIQEYFNQHGDLFKVEQPLLKGLFIKVPLVAPQIGNVRRWYKSDKLDAIERLEKYSFQNAVKYEYFYDRWVPLQEVLSMLPLHATNPEKYLETNRQLELKDTAFYYFLNVTDFLPAGSHEPYVYAHGEIKDMLVNIKQVDFMRKVKNELYDKAVKKKEIIYNY